MTSAGVSRSQQEPEPEQCAGPSDVGRLHYNETDDIWYECLYDARLKTFTWAIVPPTD